MLLVHAKISAAQYMLLGNVARAYGYVHANYVLQNGPNPVQKGRIRPILGK